MRCDENHLFNQIVQMNGTGKILLGRKVCSPISKMVNKIAIPLPSMLVQPHYGLTKVCVVLKRSQIAPPRPFTDILIDALCIIRQYMHG